LFGTGNFLGQNLEANLMRQTTFFSKHLKKIIRKYVSINKTIFGKYPQISRKIPENLPKHFEEDYEKVCVK